MALMSLSLRVFAKVFTALLFVAVSNCQETTLEDDATTASEIEQRKEKRGIALNLGSGLSGLEGYSYLGPSNSRGLNYGAGRYTPPVNDYGKAGRVHKLIFMFQFLAAERNCGTN